MVLLISELMMDMVKDNTVWNFGDLTEPKMELTWLRTSEMVQGLHFSGMQVMMVPLSFSTTTYSLVQMMEFTERNYGKQTVQKKVLLWLKIWLKAKVLPTLHILPHSTVKYFSLLYHQIILDGNYGRQTVLKMEQFN